MIQDNVAARDESPSSDRPIFILAYTGTARNGDAAMIVELRNNAPHAYGFAFMELVPLFEGKLRDSVERPNNGGIYDATVDII